MLERENQNLSKFRREELLSLVARFKENGLLRLFGGEDKDAFARLMGQDEIPSVEAANFIEQRFNDKGRAAFDDYLDDYLRDHKPEEDSDHLSALIAFSKTLEPQLTLGEIGPRGRGLGRAVEALAPQVKRVREILSSGNKGGERRVIFPAEENRGSIEDQKGQTGITPLGGDILGKLLSTRRLLLDHEIGLMTVEGVREWLEMKLALVRSQNDEKKSLALQKQVTAVEGFLRRVLNEEVDWKMIFTNGLTAYYDTHNIPEDQRFDLATPQGMTIAVRELYPELAAAILAASEVAGEQADGLLARTVEREKTWLALLVEVHRRELEELQQKNRALLEGLKIKINKELADRYAAAFPSFKSQSEASRDLRAIEATTWVATLNVILRELLKIPIAMPAGALEQIKKEATENKPMAIAGVGGLIGAGVAVLHFGLPLSTALCILAGSLAGGALITGLLTRPKKLPSTSERESKYSEGNKENQGI